MSGSTEYEKWAKRYAVDEYIFGTAPSTLLSDHAALLQPGMTALSIADGEGRNGVYLAERGLAVTSFDFSPPAIAKARRLAASRNVSLTMHQADITQWDWARTQYDAVIGVFFQFLAPPERAAAFKGIAAAVRPGGLLLLRGYTPKQLDHNTGGPSQLDHFYTPDLLRHSFPGFDIIHLAEQEQQLTEGSRHAGMSAYVDFIACKPPATA